MRLAWGAVWQTQTKLAWVCSGALKIIQTFNILPYNEFHNGLYHPVRDIFSLPHHAVHLPMFYWSFMNFSYNLVFAYILR